MPGAICERKLKPRTDLGRRILLLCEAKGHANLRAAADASGLCYTQLRDIVVGRRDPRVSTLARIAEAVGATLPDLFKPLSPQDSGCDAVDVQS